MRQYIAAYLRARVSSVPTQEDDSLAFWLDSQEAMIRTWQPKTLDFDLKNPFHVEIWTSWRRNLFFKPSFPLEKGKAGL